MRINRCSSNGTSPGKIKTRAFTYFLLQIDYISGTKGKINIYNTIATAAGSIGMRIRTGHGGGTSPREIIYLPLTQNNRKISNRGITDRKRNIHYTIATF
jgi:hypothetical protein